MSDQPLVTLALDRVLELVVVFTDDMTRGLAAAGLTVPRAHLLWVLRAGGPQTQQSLAAAIGVTPRNITGLVDGLVATGFVSREPHPTDRRALLIRLTPHGVDVTEALAAGQQALGRALFGDLDEVRLRDFVDLTALVTARLTAAVATDEARAGTAAAAERSETGRSDTGPSVTERTDTGPSDTGPSDTDRTGTDRSGTDRSGAPAGNGRRKWPPASFGCLLPP